MCKFCENDGTRKGIEKAPVIVQAEIGELLGEKFTSSLYIAGGEIRLETTCGKNEGLEYKKINFCPFCGASL